MFLFGEEVGREFNVHSSSADECDGGGGGGTFVREDMKQGSCTTNMFQNKAPRRWLTLASSHVLYTWGRCLRWERVHQLACYSITAAKELM